MNERNSGRAGGGTVRAARGAAAAAWRRGAVRLGLAIAWASAAGGCAGGPGELRTVPAVAEAPKPVRLTITNEATRAWHLSFLDLDGFEVKQVRLAAREEATVELAGGEYTLEQAMLATSGARESVRRFPLRLKAGGTYNWTLATLLGDAATALRVDRMAARE